jgi:hypothetical protein
MTKQKRQVIILCGLFLVLAFTIYRTLVTSDNVPGAAGNENNPAVAKDLPLDLKDIYLKRNPRRTGGKKEVSFKEIDPSIHLNKLEEFDPGEPLNARNMFSIQSPPPEPPAVSRNTRPSAASGPSDVAGPTSTPPVVRTPPPPTVIINLKFFGTTTDIRQKIRQGFFAEGDAVYLAAEGDLLANRYRVIHIGDSSAEVEEVSSKTRRQISLAQ